MIVKVLHINCVCGKSGDMEKVDLNSLNNSFVVNEGVYMYS
uniref:Uncharacterized protein n=1 Tax=Bartonella schoenbuchensis (strain DSM 13525 / NCTC 13165 / R1) TaxID=687861 RepID=E6YYJ4_BARSR|nr:hypothetical protein B11C_20282 [Bartonella schoenbuchensis R1]